MKIQTIVIAVNIQSKTISSYRVPSKLSLFARRVVRNNSNAKPHIKVNTKPSDNAIERMLSQYALYGNLIATINNQNRLVI